MVFTLEQVRADLPVNAVVTVHYETGKRFDRDKERVERKVYGKVTRSYPLTISNFDKGLDVPSDAAHVRIELEEILDYRVYEKP